MKNAIRYKIISFLTIVFLLNLSYSAFAQGLQFEFSMGYSVGNFYSSQLPKKQPETAFYGLGSNFNFGIATKVVGKIYLKTQIGGTSFNDVISFTYDDLNFSGTFSKDQIFISIFPEYRFVETKYIDVYANIGLGWYHNISNGYSDVRVYSSTAGFSGGILYSGNDLANYVESPNFGFGVNIGVDGKIGKTFGMGLNIGFNQIVPDKLDQRGRHPNIGIRRFSMQYKIIYFLSSKEQD